jgi:pantothenate synthetase
LQALIFLRLNENQCAMTFENLAPEQRKQLIEFYKAMKMAAKMFSQGNPTTKNIIQLADQIIAELKKEEPDQAKIKSMAERLQFMANPH